MNSYQLPMEGIEQALSYIDPDDRDTWYRVGMALKNEFGDSAFTMWDAWSLRSDSYKRGSTHSVWKSLHQPLPLKANILV